MGRQSDEDAHLCMKRRVVLDETVIEVFDEEMITAIKLLSSKHYGCLLDRANESQFTLIKMPFSQEGLTVDGRRLMYEITFSLNPPNIAIRAHGQSVSLEDLSLIYIYIFIYIYIYKQTSRFFQTYFRFLLPQYVC